ncbi:hypothetical protein ACIRVF_10560 [Kitasatospora sp. NPDC101157]|uniref:hypothetical protein n=1 Tax=Kitasatospora sp. NPDC101157 TaxID=3364098 RepID=UPI00382B7A98
MPRPTRTKQDAFEVETYRLDLADDERTDFLADPGVYLRSFLEAQGHTVNAVVYDPLVVSGSARPMDVVHVLKPQYASSNRMFVPVDLP